MKKILRRGFLRVQQRFLQQPGKSIAAGKNIAHDFSLFSGFYNFRNSVHGKIEFFFHHTYMNLVQNFCTEDGALHTIPNMVTAQQRQSPTLRSLRVRNTCLLPRSWNKPSNSRYSMAKMALRNWHDDVLLIRMNRTASED
ncbi:unnamed protein product [Nesidiocoris tenuis]|uniref:Uncharacterized protein n=1 Tax=Nesidiocoris tenuis TaxID=355587 RepID=A0A6H5H247_9HEMI|nr:unnamed protein product [Nesidiocoris tenuis]